MNVVSKPIIDALSATDAAKAKAAATYNAAADHFDDEPLAFWARHGRATVDRLALRPGATVLDVGCGTGASALPAAERVGPAGRVIGVDLAEGLLAKGRAKATERGLRNVEFRTGDMAQLGYPDGHFDAVVCVFAIFFLPDMERQVAELWRMVRPGGQLAITTWGPRFCQPGASYFWSAVRRARPDLHAAFNPWDRISDPEAVRQLLRDGGVPTADVVAVDDRQVLRSPEEWWTVVLGAGFRWTVEQMGPTIAAQVRNVCIECLWENGVSQIETNAIYAVATKDEI